MLPQDGPQVKMAGRSRDNNRVIRMLRVLAGPDPCKSQTVERHLGVQCGCLPPGCYHDEDYLVPLSLSTPELARETAADVQPWRAALARCGGLLRYQEALGHVRQAGTVRGAYRNVPAIAWQITDDGRQWLDEREQALTVKAEQPARNMRAEAKRAWHLKEARASYDRSAPRPVRKQVAHQLRDLGCTLDQIGLVFGMTGATIRLDLLWDPDGPPRPRKPRTLRTPKPRRRSRPHFSPRQTELLLDMYLGHHGEYYPLFLATSSALQKRGLITKGSGLGSIALTAEGQAVARELAGVMPAQNERP